MAGTACVNNTYTHTGTTHYTVHQHIHTQGLHSTQYINTYTYRDYTVHSTSTHTHTGTTQYINTYTHRDYTQYEV